MKKRCARLLSEIRSLEQTDSWAGLRPAGRVKNYELGWSGRVPAMYHVAAIRSTGLSSCLGLSEYVLEELAARGLESRPNGQGPVTPRFGDDPPRPWWERLNALRGANRP